MKSKPIILVAGEPKSIFLEILFKSLIKIKIKSPVILICSRRELKTNMKRFKYKKKIREMNLDELSNYKLNNKKINLIHVDYFPSNKNLINLKLKKKYINECFKIAFEIIKKGYTKKLINGPINKKIFLGNKFPGITEFISSKFNQKKFGMLIYNKRLSVSPLTTHLPLKKVAKKINKKLIIDRIVMIDNFFRKKLKIKPIIGVTALNPHGESFDKFNEDEKIVLKAIKYFDKKKISVKGPFSADTIFLKNNRKKFNIIIGMYHDQVLTPIKTLFEYNAINLTMGLPFFRVSPDHGPNEKMFGKNKSDPKSLIMALKFLDNK